MVLRRAPSTPNQASRKARGSGLPLPLDQEADWRNRPDTPQSQCHTDRRRRKSGDARGGRIDLEAKRLWDRQGRYGSMYAHEWRDISRQVVEAATAIPDAQGRFWLAIEHKAKGKPPYFRERLGGRLWGFSFTADERIDAEHAADAVHLMGYFALVGTPATGFTRPALKPAWSGVGDDGGPDPNYEEECRNFNRWNDDYFGPPLYKRAELTIWPETKITCLIEGHYIKTRNLKTLEDEDQWLDGQFMESTAYIKKLTEKADGWSDPFPLLDGWHVGQKGLDEYGCDVQHMCRTWVQKEPKPPEQQSSEQQEMGDVVKIQPKPQGSPPPPKPEQAKSEQPKKERDKPLIVQLAEKLWGPAEARPMAHSERVQYHIGRIVIDPNKDRWFDFENNNGGGVNDLMKMLQTPAQSTEARLMQSSAEFVADFVPPDYLIDGLLQRRFVYSMTGPTGSGKTAIALLIALCVALGLDLAEREVVKGRVLFFAGENPDDVRTRWIKLCEEMGYDPDKLDVVFMPFTLNLSEAEIRAKIDAEAAEHGPFSLLIVDTSAAYYSGDDENDNVKLGAHARLLRSFIDLPGGPTILVTCHPVKNPDMSNLLPRGGGAFLAEVDGNLVCILDRPTMMVEVTTHGKFRGPEFTPFSFKLVAGQSDKLVDSKGRHIWTIFARAVSNEEVEAIKKVGHSDQDDVLRAMLNKPESSLLELAEYLGWRMEADKKPNKNKVHRFVKDLHKHKLCEQTLKGNYILTEKGRKEAEKTPELELAAAKKPDPLRGRAPPPGKVKFAIQNLGPAPEGSACAHCHETTGEVCKIKNLGEPGSKSETLHQDCAREWFAQMAK